MNQRMHVIKLLGYLASTIRIHSDVCYFDGMVCFEHVWAVWGCQAKYGSC